MAEEVEGFESCVEERIGCLSFTLKREQELSMRHLFDCIDVMAVLPTGFGKKCNFSDICNDVQNSK